MHVLFFSFSFSSFVRLDRLDIINAVHQSTWRGGIRVSNFVTIVELR